MIANTKGAVLISIVDDDESIRKGLGRLFRSVGFEVDGFASAEEFLNTGDLQRSSCLILDLRMPGMSGLELQSRLAAGQWQIPIIFLSAHSDEQSRALALKAGAIEFVSKPFNEASLIRDVNKAVDQHRSNAH
ncbi:MAG TPA: response regulator [Blastocatellia bacterium]|nr:response regulator [Blastocatellia bacterium]